MLARRAGDERASSREVYRTSRLLDFASARELTAQIGHRADQWPQVALKELVDNGSTPPRRPASRRVISVGSTAACSRSRTRGRASPRT